MPDASMASGSKISYDWGTSTVQKALYTQTYTIFNSLQRIQEEALYAKSAGKGIGQDALIPSVETIQYYQRISEHYARAIQEFLVKSQQAVDVPDNATLRKWQEIQTVLRLAELLYYPKDGRGISVVGEELLHWLNSFDVAPTTEEGLEIAQSAVPHTHPAYWDYILRCVLRGFHTSAASVLKSLDSHPSKVIRSVAQKTARLLSTLPRSTNFAMENEFVAAHRFWLVSVRKLISGLEQEMDEMEADAGNSEEIEDERLEYEAQFRCLLELMAGVKDRIFEACEDWREALGAWGTLVHPTLKRDDVPNAASIILEKFPLDGTMAAEVVQAHLVQGQVRQAVNQSHRLDIWLAAHLGDLMDKVGLLDDEDDQSQSITVGGRELREHLLLAYAQNMLDEQGLWRISIDYLAVCGAEGRKKMSKVVLSVPTVGPYADVQEDFMDQDVSDEGRTKPKLERAEQVLRACTEHGLEAEARVVCKRMSRSLLAEDEFGLAIAYCVRASDTVLIRTIADKILDVYATKGADAFNEIVDSFPSSLIEPCRDFEEDAENGRDRFGGRAGLARGFFSRRLAFLARFRDFHRLYADGHWGPASDLLVELITTEAAPEHFIAVLLVDTIPLLEDAQAAWFDKAQTFELLRVVERITSAVSMHPTMSDHFLVSLNKLLGVHSEQKQLKSSGALSTAPASDKLDVVRLSLARNLARVGITQVGIV